MEEIAEPEVTTQPEKTFEVPDISKLNQGTAGLSSYRAMDEEGDDMAAEDLHNPYFLQEMKEKGDSAELSKAINELEY